MLTLTDITTQFSTWHIARAAGLTAYLLLFATTTCGLLLSLQLIPIKYRQKALSIHTISVYSLLLFTLLHATILLFDKHVSFSLADIFIPFWTDYHSWPMALGILSFYGLVLISITAIPLMLKFIGYKRWRYMHYFTFGCYWLALYHGLTLGTDSRSLIVLGLYASTAGITFYLSGLRVWKYVIKKSYHNSQSDLRRKQLASIPGDVK